MELYRNCQKICVLTDGRFLFQEFHTLLSDDRDCIGHQKMIGLLKMMDADPNAEVQYKFFEELVRRSEKKVKWQWYENNPDVDIDLDPNVIIKKKIPTLNEIFEMIREEKDPKKQLELFD